jgi:hypothetical protein
VLILGRVHVIAQRIGRRHSLVSNAKAADGLAPRLVLAAFAVVSSVTNCPDFRYKYR